MVYDVRRESCCNGSSDLELMYQMQAAQAMIAVYSGGYIAKIQDLGVEGFQRLQVALNLKFEVKSKKKHREESNSDSKRLVKDFEAKVSS